MNSNGDGMMLCLDVGNSHVYGGVFDGGQLKLRFRHASSHVTSDEIGIFLRSVLRENQCDPASICDIAMCSVVPALDYSLRAACLKYFSVEPFCLQAGARTGLDIRYHNPSEVGADRIANAIAATREFPGKNLVIIDFGTATTFCAVRGGKTYLGGTILPGVRLSVEALSANTAKLPRVEIVKPKQVIGRTTEESIQSGIFYGALGACREVLSGIRESVFANEAVLVLATGGFASLFDNHGLFDLHLPDLVLQGVRHAALMNHSAAPC